MDAKDTRTLVLNSFFVILGCGLFVLHLYAFILENILPQVFQIERSTPIYGCAPFNYLGGLTAGSVLISLANCIFYSKKPLIRRKIRTRQLIHYFFTIGVVLFLSIGLNWTSCSRAVDVSILMAIVTIFYIGALTLSEFRIKKDHVEEINHQLREIFGAPDDAENMDETINS